MTAVDEIQQQTEALAAATEREVAGIYAGIAAGLIAREAAVLLIASVINNANAAAVSLGDLFLALQIEEVIDEPVPTVGIAPTDHSDRRVKAAKTILFNDDTDTDDERVDTDTDDEQVDDDTDQESDPADDESISRLTRLARAEPLETAQLATHEAMQQQPLVEGWVRQFDANPCQLCVWWWREGRIWPKEHPFQTPQGLQLPGQGRSGRTYPKHDVHEEVGTQCKLNMRTRSPRTRTWRPQPRSSRSTNSPSITAIPPIPTPPTNRRRLTATTSSGCAARTGDTGSAPSGPTTTPNASMSRSSGPPAGWLTRATCS